MPATLRRMMPHRVLGRLSDHPWVFSLGGTAWVGSISRSSSRGSMTKNNSTRWQQKAQTVNMNDGRISEETCIYRMSLLPVLLVCRVGVLAPKRRTIIMYWLCAMLSLLRFNVQSVWKDNKTTAIYAARSLVLIVDQLDNLSFVSWNVH